MCGAIATKCDAQGCSNYVRYSALCHKCLKKYNANLNHLTGV